jgi:hypothetical protein
MLDLLLACLWALLAHAIIDRLRRCKTPAIVFMSSGSATAAAPSVLARIVGLIVHAAQARGVGAAELLAGSGLDPAWPMPMRASRWPPRRCSGRVPPSSAAMPASACMPRR